jgi:hypothetical protein
MTTPTWSEISQTVREYHRNSRTWHSEQTALLRIYQYAQEMGLDPENASLSCMSNLIDIIASARIAMERNWINRLVKLFDMAAHMTSRELRLALGKRDIERIPCYKDMVGARICYNINLTLEQLERISMSTDQFYEFVEA